MCILRVYIYIYVYVQIYMALEFEALQAEIMIPRMIYSFAERRGFHLSLV